MTIRRLAVHTDDGIVLEGELDPGGDPQPGMSVVLCHPHPQYGGSMRSLVTSVLFRELPAAGYPALRFNFRGVEGSTGSYSDGEREPLDVIAALAAIAEAFPSTPIALVGWSFGADISLSVTDPRLAGWVAIAPPLRFRTEFAAAGDPRPKHLVLAEHDEFRAPAEISREVEQWTRTSVAVIAGASHFFVGRTDRVVAETMAGIGGMAAR